MQRAFLPFSLLMLTLAGAPQVARATGRPTLSDTIVVRLPNRATLTLTVRDAAQLREMKSYHLDSLTTKLAGYITQAEAAAKAGTSDEVTMRFYPDKDQPGKNLPEQIRITTHKKSGVTAGNSKVEVMLNKTFGVVVTTDEHGSKTGITMDGKSKEARQASRDSSRRKSMERHHTSANLILDVGLNAFVNQKPYTTAAGQPEAVELRPEGSRYVNIGFNWDPRLGGKHSPLNLTVGPEFAFNNYMLNGNDRWISANGRTDVVRQTDGRQLLKTKLATSSVNLPMMLRLQLHDSHYKPTFTVGAGGFIGYNLSSWTKLKYVSDGNTYKDKDHSNYNVENFLYGVQGTIGYRSVEFFGKYNMNNLFKTNAGPSTQVLSFGVRVIGIN